MEYMTLKEAGEKWGVFPRRVNYYCAAGRIPGAVKMASQRTRKSRLTDAIKALTMERSDLLWRIF